MGNNLAGLTYYSTNENDPYITLKDMVRRVSGVVRGVGIRYDFRTQVGRRSVC